MTRRRTMEGAPDLSPVVIDTNIVSYIYKGDSRATSYLPHLTGRLLVISFMTLAELDAWMEVSRWGPNRREQLDRFLDGYVVHYPDRDLCRLWAAVYAGARATGKPIQSGDAWIAATALLYGVPLITHDPRDYVGVMGLQVVTEPNS